MKKLCNTIQQISYDHIKGELIWYDKNRIMDKNDNFQNKMTLGSSR